MEERITRRQAIRLKCLDCCCGNRAEVRSCHLKTCPLWRYRMGNEQLTNIEPLPVELDANSDRGIV